MTSTFPLLGALASVRISAGLYLFMSPISAVSGSLAAIVILQYLLNSQAGKAWIPPFLMPMSSPIAPEKKLNATISGRSFVSLSRSIGLQARSA